MATRNKTEVYLVGQPLDSFGDRLLPTGKDILRRIASHGANSHENRKKVVDEVLQLWAKARIPTMETRAIIEKLNRILDKYEKLKINRKRKTEQQQTNESLLNDEISKLFDISHKDALSLVTIGEDKDFLIDQRAERNMVMGGEDKMLANKEKKKWEREKQMNERRKREKEAMEAQESVVQLVDSSTSSSDTEPSEQGSPHRCTRRSSSTVPKRLKMTAEMVSALDRSNISDRRAVHILEAGATAVGQRPLSRSSVRRARIKERSLTAAILRDSFIHDVEEKDASLVLHWDGKLLPDLTGKGEGAKVERLPILISSPDMQFEKLLAIPKLPAGTGAAMAHATIQTVREWKLEDRVEALCFDTTASNTGIHSGCCQLIEVELGRPLLYLACRHHIMELILATVFKAVMAASSGPEIQLFKRFREQWSFIPVEGFLAFSEPRVDDYKEWRDKTISSMKASLENKKTRDDYAELCQISLYFLTGELRAPIRKPGAFHHARWMAKAIYVLKLLMFRVHMKLTRIEEAGLREVALFIVLIYARNWMEAPRACDAAVNDRALLDDLLRYKTVNEKIGKAALTTFQRHLWYLGSDLVGFSLFSRKVSTDEKRDMLRQMRTNKSSIDRKRWIPEEGEITSTSLIDLASPASLRFLKTLRIKETFLELPPEQWEDDESFKDGRIKLEKLKVVNDGAERGVAMITTFNDTLTRDEETKQALLQVVEHHRRLHPLK
jgi:hypothetical protein